MVRIHVTRCDGTCETALIITGMEADLLGLWSEAGKPIPDGEAWPSGVSAPVRCGYAVAYAYDLTDDTVVRWSIE